MMNLIFVRALLRHPFRSKKRKSYRARLKANSRCRLDPGHPFVRFVDENLDRDYYLRKNPEVAAQGGDAFSHFLNVGFQKRSRISPTILVNIDSFAAEPRGGERHRFLWQGTHLLATRTKTPDEAVIAQIRDQARHDSSVLSAGRHVVRSLNAMDYSDVFNRDGFDFNYIWSSGGFDADVLLIVPRVPWPDPGNFVTSLLALRASAPGLKFIVLVTDQGEAQGRRDLAADRAGDFAGVQVEFCDRIWAGGSVSARTLARYINALRPKRVIAMQSRMAYEAIAVYGRGLARQLSLYCCYFRAGEPALDAFGGERFHRKTFEFALSLTDASDRAQQLQAACVGAARGVARIPPRCDDVDEARFRERLARRREALRAAGPIQWAWVGPVDDDDGVAVLAALAGRRAGETFFVFGGPTPSLPLALSNCANLRREGLMPDFATADLSQFRAFIGAPGIDDAGFPAFEAAHAALPMVLPRVGAARDTFDDRCALFVEPADPAEAPAAFSDALDRCLHLTPEAIEAMAMRARGAVAERNSLAAFRRAATQALGLPT